MKDKFWLDYSYHNVPEHTREALENYLFRGWQPGSFLTYVLQNNLAGACGSCDHVNREALVDIVKFIEHRVPSGAWGSREAVRNWLDDVDHIRTQYAKRIEQQVMWETLNT